MNSAVIRISTEAVIESASPMSSNQPGIGRMSMAMIAVTPIASARSRLGPSRFRNCSSLGGRPERPTAFIASP